MKRIGIRSISIILFIVCFIIIGKVWRYILVDDTTSYTRVMMHELYNTGNIDIVFIGSSHVYRSLVPSITDEEFRCYTFNAGSSLQQMDGSLALIKEVAKNHDLKHVYLELYYAVAEEKYSDRSELTPTYILSDYMRPSFDKIQYLLHASANDYWVNSFITARRNWTNFFDADYVMNLIKKKGTEEYRNYILNRVEGVSEYYVERGFVANDDMSSNLVWNDKAYGEINIDKLYGSDWEKSIVDAINYCKYHNIEITLFVAPEPEWTIVGKGNYQEYYEYVKSLASSNAVEFFDFNLCSNRYFDTSNLNLFKDTDHLNTGGAEAFSHIFGQFFTNKIKKEDLFYTEFEDKLNSEEPKVYGIAGPINNLETGTRDCYIISNRESEILYRIVITTEDGEYIVQDFDTNKFFSIPLEENGKVLLSWRTIYNPDEIHILEAAY